MIIIDASAMIEVLLHRREPEPVERLLVTGEDTLHAPHLLDAEVAQVMRKFVANGSVERERAGLALVDLADWPLQRHSHTWLLPRIWSLRENFTAYDACYVALAEALDATLLTRDRRLASVARRFTRVELV